MTHYIAWLHELGMQDLAISTREVLAQNYPDKRFKQYGEARARRWWFF